MRVSKLISERGVASRREAERLVQEGLVTVNGQVIEHPGHPVDPASDHVKVRGRLLPGRPTRIWLVMHKPAGIITSTRDPEGRETVSDLLDGTRYAGKVEAVGRLDYGTEGLLLLTNDGELAQRLTHPRYHVPKTYLVKITGSLDRKKLLLLRRGVPLEDGRTAPAVVQVKESRERNSWVRVVVREGRNRLVRRMFEFVGHRVLKLKRTALGGIELGDLPPREVRVLEGNQVQHLRAMTEGEGARYFQLELDRQEHADRTSRRPTRRKGTRRPVRRSRKRSTRKRNR